MMIFEKTMDDGRWIVDGERRKKAREWLFKVSIGFVLISGLFWDCSDSKSKNVSPSFYHWQTHFQLNKTASAYLDLLNAKKLYVKFFDIDWDVNRQQPAPLAILQATPKTASSVTIIPTIFITNRTFSNLEEKNIPNLVQKTKDKIFQLYEELQQSQALYEIQLDCDWSLNTKAKYFKFIEQLEEQLMGQNIQISATIRLHQIKYFEKTGVPPVQKGMLMFYNMGDVSDITMNNSILDWDIAEKYLVNFDRYPLPLDLALPLFSWGVLIRNDKMIKLINDLQSEDLADTTRFVKTEKNRYKVQKSTYLDGYYLYKDDQIRLESVSYPLLEESVDRLRPFLINPDLTVAFYHLDTTIIKRYPYERLEKLCKKLE